jgi:hypothetical protein
MPANTMDMESMKENFVSFIIFIVIILIIIVITICVIYIRRLNTSNCNYMTNLYGTLDGNISSIDPSSPDSSGNLRDYYIKTAYNACSGGSYKNDYVNICNLKNVLKQGVRGIDLEIYSIDNKPVVSTSTSNSYYIKETFNYVNFSDVMSTIKNYAFSSGTAPNYNDPLILHLRFQSSNQTMYTNTTTILQSYDSILLGSDYSFETNRTNLGSVPLLDLMGKVVIIVDRSNTAFVENQAFLEYVNMASNSVFMRAITYYDVKNTPDMAELQDFNKTGMSIVFPENGVNPPNPSAIVTGENGCQMTAMRFQNTDSYLEQYNSFFDEAGYAFVLKPLKLRYEPVMVDQAKPQDKKLSYETRTSSTDYYSINF